MKLPYCLTALVSFQHNHIFQISRVLFGNVLPFQLPTFFITLNGYTNFIVAVLSVDGINGFSQRRLFFPVHGIEQIALNGIVPADSPYDDTGFFIKRIQLANANEFAYYTFDYSTLSLITTLNPNPLVFLEWSEAYRRDTRQFFASCHQLPPRRMNTFPPGITSFS